MISVCHVSLSNLDNTAAFHFPGINNQQIEHLKLGTITSYSGLCGLIIPMWIKPSFRSPSNLKIHPLNSEILALVSAAVICFISKALEEEEAAVVFVSSCVNYSGPLCLIVLRFDTNEYHSSLHVSMKF